VAEHLLDCDVGARDTLQLTSNGSLYCTGFWLCILSALGVCSGGKGGDHCNLKEITPKKLQARQFLELRPGVRPPPTAGYKLHGKHLDVDQSGVSTAFAVDVRNHGHSIVVWNLHAAAPELLSLEPKSPSSLLVMSGRKKITQTLCVAEDPESIDGGAGGPALLVACADGSVLAWDLKGWDKGGRSTRKCVPSPIERSTHHSNYFCDNSAGVVFWFSHLVKWPHVVRAPLIAIGHFVLLDPTAWRFDMSFVCIRSSFATSRS